jgi:hypothetical protein
VQYDYPKVVAGVYKTIAISLSSCPGMHVCFSITIIDHDPHHHHHSAMHLRGNVEKYRNALAP